ncbi:unnamed protein product [Adineta ricciae]|nr:unnamed protein product [Adineta ricciae]
MFQHITLYHQNEPNFSITCDLHNACGVLYRTYSAYKAHVYRQHISELHLKNKPNDNRQQENINSSTVNSEVINNGDDTFYSVYGTFEENPVDDDLDANFCNTGSFFPSTNVDESVSELLSIIKRSYLLFILELREEYLLPQGVTNIISTYIVTLLRHLEILLNKKATAPYTNSYQSSTSALPKRNQKVIEIHQLNETLNDLSDTIEAVSKNNYQFMKNCEKYFGLISPEQVVLSSPGESVELGYFIPIDRTISSMLKSQPLLIEILENIHQQRITVDNDPDLMFSVRDGMYGSRFDEESLLIQLYLDDIGLTNPLGAKRDRHKMTMIYFSLEDMPDKYRSKLDFIQLVAVCESKQLKVNFSNKNGICTELATELQRLVLIVSMETISFYIISHFFFENNDKAQRFFAPIVENLNKLQLNGISINGVHLTFSFSTVVADNLASHFIGAFQSCFNGGYFCRRCYITYPEKNLPISLEKIQTRSMTDHDSLVDEITNDPTGTPLKGVMGPSPLRELIGFHATTSLPRDLMHDYLEGICPMIIMSLLKQASALRILTYSENVFAIFNPIPTDFLA